MTKNIGVIADIHSNYTAFKTAVEYMEKEGIEDVIYVGDTFKDYLQAKKAGVKFIHAGYGFGKIKNKVISISSFDELEEAINKLSFKKPRRLLK